MIRMSLRLLLTAALFCVFSITAHADVVDNCADLSLSYASYSNFSPVPGGNGPGGGWPNPPDSSFLIVTSVLQPASVVYTLQGAERIGISIYSRMATFATQNNEGQYILGLKNAQMANQPKYRTHYCGAASNEGQIFLQLGGQTLLYQRDARYRTTFSPIEHTHSHTEFMGVNAYTSVDGTTFSPLQLSIENVVVNSDAISITHYYERYTANVPAGVKYIKIMLRDFTAIDTAFGIIPQLNPSRLHLAEVRFEGTNVIAGTPAPPLVPGGQDKEDSKSGSSEQTTGGGLTKDILKEWLGEASASSAPKKQASSSSSAASSRSSSSTSQSRASSSAAVSSQTATEPAVMPTDATAKPVALVQTLPASPPKNNWKTIAMTAVYLLSAVGVIGRLAYKLL